MNIILLLFFLLLFGISYILGKFDILSPWFMLCAMFLLCYAVVLLNTYNWDVQYSYKTIIYILISVLAWGEGSLIAKMFPVSKKFKIKYIRFRPLFNQYPVFIIAPISCILAFVYCGNMFALVGWKGNMTSTLRAIYDATVSGASPGFIANQFFAIVEVFAYLSIFYMLKFSVKVRRLIIYCIPIIAYSICILFSTDRNTLLRLFIYSISIYILLFQKKYSRNINFKILAKILPVTACCVLVFFFVGKAKNYQSNFGTAISIYSGSGLYGFNLFVNKFENSDLLHGFSSFYTILGVLQKMGMHIKDLTPFRFDSFIGYISTNGYYFSTNVYTALKRYLEDFGVTGILVIPLMVGFFYERFFCILRRKKSDLVEIYYAMLIYPIVYFPITEQLFTRMHLGSVYEICWMYILYHIFINQQESLEVR